ncbi:MAG TPA: peptide-methionine (S)-S-oxide reductase, partial [Polyangiaceae bacterium]|nr:peptide-methionine (S)-S-oxide reductase [Polyangiaceae bacterium]
MNARLLAPALLLLLAACRSGGAGKLDEGDASRASAVARRDVGTNPGKVGAGTPLEARPGHELAAFAAGCFWGVEDTFRQVPGVVATAVGYTGGRTTNPSYMQVSSHRTGHAETV